LQQTGCIAAKLPYSNKNREEQLLQKDASMLQVVILICSTSLSPMDCQSNTALDVIYGPQTSNAMMCGMQGQAFVARTAIVGRSPNEFIKIRCSPLKPIKAALRQ
jgi:hypothetical protein